MYIIIKFLITTLVVVAVSELARRYTVWAALLASLPLVSILAFTWVYLETKDTQKIIELSYAVFWLVIPSLSFFLFLPALLKFGFNFSYAMGIAIICTTIIYGIGIWIMRFIH